MNFIDQMRAAESARDEASRQRYRRSRLHDVETILTLVMGEPVEEDAGWRWRCFLGNHGNTLSVVLPAVAGEPVIVCEQGCDPRQLADVLDLLNRCRHRQEYEAMIEARRKAATHGTHAGNIIGSGGRSRLITETDDPEIPTGSPRQLALWEQTMGGLE